MIKLGITLNILHIIRQLVAFFLVGLSVIYLILFKGLEIYFPDIFKNSKINILFSHLNANELVINYLIMVVVGIILYQAIARIFTKKPKPLTRNPNSRDLVQPVFDQIRQLINDKKQVYRFEPHLSNTFIQGITIFLSLKDITDYRDGNTDKVLFKIHHEIFHHKTLDESLGKFEKILSKAFAVVLAFPMGTTAGWFLQDVVKIIYPEHPNFVDFFIMTLSLYFVWKIIKRSFNGISRSKECLCDMYSAASLKLSQINKELSSDSCDTHPSIPERDECAKGSYILLAESYLSNSLLAYAVFFLLFGGLPLMGDLLTIFIVVDLLLFLIIFTRILFVSTRTYIPKRYLTSLLLGSLTAFTLHGFSFELITQDLNLLSVWPLAEQSNAITMYSLTLLIISLLLYIKHSIHHENT